VDALFMATSAVCITGLSVADISTNFSMFGQTVVIVLIQVGG
jgi:Trk-type K+ transport system membrane component